MMASAAAADVSGFAALDERVRKFVRMLAGRPTLFLGVAILTILTLGALLAPWLAPSDPNQISVVSRMRFPSADHWFGTDKLGRDLSSRVLFGARVSLTIGLSVAILATLLGSIVGLLCGLGRIVDMVFMRIIDGLMAIPPILLAVALVALTRANAQNVIIALTIGEAPRVVRLVRSVVLSAREEPYVEGAITSGTRALPILYRHILPNALGPVLVQATYIFASAMIAEAALSFIGAGMPSDLPSWGNIMSEARAIWQVRPYIVFIPAAFLSVAVLSVTMIGDGLRDALDPRMVKRL
jgi:peptide/nickel transport system permease protein